SQAILQVGSIGGVQVLYRDSSELSVNAAPLRGRMTVDQALSRLLAGTGYTYEYTRPGVITLRPVDRERGSERVLGPVRVEGADYVGPPKRGEGVARLGGERLGQDKEAKGYRPNVATIASGAPTAIEDIPRSISVITQQQMETQEITDIGEA